VKINECDVTYVVQCNDVVPNASFARHDARHDVSHCSVEEMNIVMFINQIEYVSVGILILKSFDCVH
jgi:hypothetical protein